jgi:hypothetical protein
MNPPPRFARQALRAFLAEASQGVPPAEIRGDTPLVESGLLSSLSVADLLLLLEELRGRPLDLRALGPGCFKDLDTIVATFLEEDT